MLIITLLKCRKKAGIYYLRMIIREGLKEPYKILIINKID